jgi:hypothetical protein
MEAKRNGKDFDRKIWVETKLIHFYNALEQLTHAHEEEYVDKTDNDRFKLQDAVTESKKCILICSNCHKELHDGMWNEDDLINDEMEEVELDIE